MGAWGALHPSNIVKSATKLVRSQLCCWRVVDGIFRDRFLAKVVGQWVKAPPPHGKCLGTSLIQTIMGMEKQQLERAIFEAVVHIRKINKDDHVK